MRRSRDRGPIHSMQGFLGWLALIAVLVSALPRGANIPVAWFGLGAVAIGLLACQLLIDLFSKGGTGIASRLWIPAVLVIAALAWGLAGTFSGATEPISAMVAWAAELAGLPAPESLVHPSWVDVDVPGAISADPIEGRNAALRIATYLALFWIAARTGADDKRALRMVRVIAIVVAAISAFGLFAAASGNNVILGELAGEGGALSASFVNRNSFATYAAFGVMASVALLLTSQESAADRSRALRGFLEGFFRGGWLVVLAFLTTATALIASQSRGGAIAAIAGGAALLVAYRSNGGRGAGPAVVLLVVGSLFVVGISASGLLGRIASTDAEEGRFIVYPATIEGIEDRPFVGHGLGAYEDVFRSYVPPEAGAAGEWDKAHNSYLEVAFELGLPAAALYYLGMILVALRVFRGAVTRRSNLAVPLMGVGCVVAAAVHSAFDFSLQIPAIGALFAVILGLAWSQSFRRDGRAEGGSRRGAQDWE